MATGELSGKTAIVAGGSLGIGRATAELLAKRGANVALFGRKQQAVDEAVAAIKTTGGTALGLTADISNSSDVEKVIKATVKQFGGIDILVNSAGIQTYGTVVETDEALWDKVFDINVKGMYLTAHFAIPEMEKRGGGAIVNVSSVQAFQSQKQVAAYTATKGAINALTRAMALDHAEQKIRVNTICPGSIDTPMLRHSADMFKAEGETVDDVVRTWGSFHPIGRVGTGEDVAELIAFLVSDRATFITGGEFKVDGALTAQIAVVLPE
jgi:NAD(P)-dependent dehydrogenase (short-subunit alcohol dehydrogenase family)